MSGKEGLLEQGSCCILNIFSGSLNNIFPYVNFLDYSSGSLGYNEAIIMFNDDDSTIICGIAKSQIHSSKLARRSFCLCTSDVFQDKTSEALL